MRTSTRLAIGQVVFAAVVVAITAQEAIAKWTLAIPNQGSSYKKTATVSGSGTGIPVAKGGQALGFVGEFSFGVCTVVNGNVTAFTADNSVNVVVAEILGTYPWKTDAGDLAPPKGDWSVSPPMTPDHAARILETADPTSPTYTHTHTVVN